MSKKIIRRASNTIRPRAFEVLLNRFNEATYHTQWGLRKPVGIYNLSFNNIIISFGEVLEELRKITIKKVVETDLIESDLTKTLMRRQEYLISLIMRHFDDCLSVLCCLYNYDDNKSRDKNRKRVINKPHVKTAMNKCDIYRQHIANIMNHIKHQQGLLNGTVLLDDHSKIIGYFVEFVDVDEIRKPHPDVHEEYKGMSTAFSFNRHLRYLIWLIYDVSEFVADAVEAIMPQTSSEIPDSGDEEYIINIIKEISLLPTKLFLDEVHMNFPNIRFISGEEERSIILTSSSQDVVLIPPTGSLKYATNWQSDGVTKRLQPPYYLNHMEGRTFDL